MLGKLWEVKWRLQHRQLAGGKTASRASPWWTQPRSYYRGPTTLSNRSIAKQHPVVVPRPQSRCHFGSETYSIKLKLKAWNLVDLGSEVELGAGLLYSTAFNIGARKYCIAIQSGLENFRVQASPRNPKSRSLKPLKHLELRVYRICGFRVWALGV